MTLDHNSPLFDEILDISFSRTNIWKQGKTTYDVDTCAHIEIEIEPEEATTINEIKFIKISQDVMGIKTCTLKKLEDNT